jgi:thiol-disulfide isomerase/thioredoxin
MYDIEKLRQNSEKISVYIRTHKIFKKNAEYELDQEVVDRFKNYANDVIIFVFSAEWCPDCKKHLPVLGLLAKATGIEVNVFGHLMRDPKKPKGYWRIPPSPPEVEEFFIKKIPTIAVLDIEGNKVGTIVENPPEMKTLEKALLDIIESASE